MKQRIIISAVLYFCACPGIAKTWHVGPGRQYTAPTQVMALVATGDTVEIDAGLYVKDVGAWNADSLVLRCSSGYAHLDAQDTAAQRKAIWVINGKHTYVEGIEFSRCAISDADGGNGAGIRLQAPGLECRRCYFHDNQEGILTGKDTTSDILIEACEFSRNGVETGPNRGYEHHIYIGEDRTLTVRFCYFHEAIVGHELKTRAHTSYILYNHIVDGTTGDASYSIDIPQGGLAFIVGNTMEKGPKAENSPVITYGEEWKPGVFNPDSEIYIVNNTFVTDRATTTFVRIAPGTLVAKLTNNIFAGAATVWTGSVDTASNIVKSDTAFFHFRHSQSYDYAITAPFPGMASATDPGSARGFSLRPTSMYVDPLDSATRNDGIAHDEPLQVGAFAMPPTPPLSIRPNRAAFEAAIYPNPIEHIATVALPATFSGERVILTLYDVTAAVALREELPVTASSLQFDRGALPAGVYSYHLLATDGAVVCSGSLVIAP